MIEESLFWDNDAFMKQIGLPTDSGKGAPRGTVDRMSGSQEARTTRPMPAVFPGHGSPMNALEENRYTAAWRTFPVWKRVRIENDVAAEEGEILWAVK